MAVHFPIEKDLVKNARIRRRLLRDGANDERAAKEIIAACGKDILFYINYFCFTYDPRLKKSVVPFITYDFQDDAFSQLLEAITNGHDVCIGKSRDMGASWINILAFEHQFHFETMKNFLMVSRNESYVDDMGNPKSLFWKIDFIHKHQPKWLSPKQIARRSMHIENCDNGSVIDGESTTGEVARGDRRTAILLDEFAAFDVKSGYNALTATQSATNCRIFNSTPKGVENAFHDVYEKSSATIIRMHWSQHPEKKLGLYCSKRNEKTGAYELVLKSDWKGVVTVCEKGTKEVRKVAFPEDYPFILDGRLRSPWYDRECSRAVNPVEIAQELDIDFYGSDYKFFDPIAIERYKEQWCRDPDAVGDLEFSVEQCSILRFTANPKGHFYLFEPISRDGRIDRDRRFVIGVDVAAGTGASNSTCAVYDRQTNEKVSEYANPKILPDDFGRFVVALARYYNDALIVPDRSGPTGEVLVNRILSEGYTNIYFRKNRKKIGAPQTDEPGIWLNPAVRTEVLQNYRDAIGHCTIINRSEIAINECMKFVMTQSGNVEHSAESNTVDPNGARANHGDMVIADALAAMVLKDGEVMDVPQEAKIPQNTLAWRIQEERKNKMERSIDSLGKEWRV